MVYGSVYSISYIFRNFNFYDFLYIFLWLCHCVDSWKLLFQQFGGSEDNSPLQAATQESEHDHFATGSAPRFQSFWETEKSQRFLCFGNL